MKGIKFVVYTDLQSSHIAVDAAIKRIIELYADYVMKNPFYQPEMPVRCELFDMAILNYVNSFNISA
jgi:hypothetical protein